MLSTPFYIITVLNPCTNRWEFFKGFMSFNEINNIFDSMKKGNTYVRGNKITRFRLLRGKIKGRSVDYDIVKSFSK